MKPGACPRHLIWNTCRTFSVHLDPKIRCFITGSLLAGHAADLPCRSCNRRLPFEARLHQADLCSLVGQEETRGTYFSNFFLIKICLCPITRKLSQVANSPRLLAEYSLCGVIWAERDVSTLARVQTSGLDLRISQTSGGAINFG